MSRNYAYRLLVHAQVTEAIGAAAGVDDLLDRIDEMSPMGDISEREARDLKPRLVDSIHDKIAAGTPPPEARCGMTYVP